MKVILEEPEIHGLNKTKALNYEFGGRYITLFRSFHVKSYIYSFGSTNTITKVTKIRAVTF